MTVIELWKRPVPVWHTGCFIAVPIWQQLASTGVRVATSELQDITCHMGSHSVTCHPTQVNMPRLTPASWGLVLHLPTPEDGRLS